MKLITLSDSSGDDASPDRPAKRRRMEAETERAMRVGMPVQLNGRMFGSSDVNVPTSSSDTDSEVVILPKKGKDKGKGKKPKTGGKRKLEERSDTDNEIEVVVPKKPAVRKSRRKMTPDKESENEIQVAIPKKGGQRNSRKQQTPENSDSDEIPAASSRKSRPKKTRKPTKPAEDEEEEEDIASRSKTRLRRSKARVSTPEPDLSDEEDDLSGSDQEQDEDALEDGGNSEDDELKEDLAFLRSSPVADRGRLRSTGSKPKSEREKALEALKKRRAGTNEPSSSAATPGRKKPVIHDTESDNDSDLEIIPEEDSDQQKDAGDETDEIEDDGSDVEMNVHDVFRETNEDEDFIDDENEGPIGAPTEDAQMPIEFTGLSTAKPRDLFKYAVEWSVMKKIHPSFASDDKVYDLAFRKLNDEVNGLANSKFSSASWTSDFTRAINARPEIVINELTKSMRDLMNAHCEACNRTNHTATWEVALTGKPYNRTTLEPLEDNEDDDDDDDDDTDGESSSSLSSSSSSAENGEKRTYNDRGEPIPPESKFFALGSTCKANAEVKHTLHHWRYELHSWVVSYLERQGHFKPDKLVKREKWSDRKREKRARKIAEKMEAEGETKRLYRLYKAKVDYALEAKNEYKAGWGRRG